MAVTLNTANPTALFTKDGGETFVAGATLTLTDAAIGDFVSFFANDADAATGIETDLIATFQVTQFAAANCDIGNRLVISDGNVAAIAQCITVNGVNGIGLYSAGPKTDPSSYPVFVAADWTQSLTLRLRRCANGDVELMEVNGVVPNPRALLPAAQAPAAPRQAMSIEFGPASPEAQCTVEYTALRSEKVIPPLGNGVISFTNFRIKEGPDRVRFRGDFKLAAGSNGIDPTTEQVTITLSTPAGQFYPPVASLNPLTGFKVAGHAPNRRWSLNDAERTRTGIEHFLLDEDPNASGGAAFRDIQSNIPAGSYATVTVEITIGNDKLVGTANLTQGPGGAWRLN